jgi:O-antigen ligase
VAYGLVGVGAALNMVLSTSRVAVASTAVAGVAVLLFVARGAPAHRRRLAGALAGVLAAAAIGVVVAGPPAPLPGVMEVVTAVQQARGPGSAAGRSAVYVATLDGWQDRPLLGWGTERDVPGVPYPAGSHSHYLGLLYQQGAVGLLLYLGAMGATWRATTPAGPAASLLRAGRWSFLVVALDAVASNPSLDATALALIWLTFALLLAAARLHHPERTD